MDEELLAVYEKHSQNILMALSYMALQLDQDLGEEGADDDDTLADIRNLELAHKEIEAARDAR